MQHHYIVIMAGGSGTRLWPLSRKQDPKQFHAFLSEKTLLQETYERALQVLPEEQIFISTTENYTQKIQEQLPHISKKRLILEPEARNTAPAIALVAATLHAHDPEAIVATIASDHAIENNNEFVSTIKAAFLNLKENPEKLITVGINPTHPDTGYGYIKIGKEFATSGDHRLFFVEDFKEKPDQKTALEYIESWGYLWNAGYFIFQAKTFLDWTEKFSPELHKAIQQTLAHPESRLACYQTAPSDPLEPLIVEKLSVDERLVIPSSLRWSDVGNWASLFQFLQEKKGVSILSEGNHLDLASKNILVKAQEKLIVTLGLENTVIIETKDALLIANKDLVGTEIKSVIEKLKETGRQDLL